MAVTNFSSHTVSVLLNNGNGTFAAAVNYGVGDGFPHEIAIEHFDGDTDPDVAVTNIGPDTVAVHLNNATARSVA